MGVYTGGRRRAANRPRAPTFAATSGLRAVRRWPVRRPLNPTPSGVGFLTFQGRNAASLPRFVSTLIQSALLLTRCSKIPLFIGEAGAFSYHPSRRHVL